MLLTYYFITLLGWTSVGLPCPLHTSGRYIVDNNNERVKFRCVNWAGHLEVNIPEGLQNQPVDTITSWIANNNFNCVRLTYSIDMALDPNQTVSDSFIAAAASTNVTQAAMQGVYNQAVQKNPFLSSATTLGTFATVIDSLQSKGIKVILDNHVSKAEWCCSITDGNGWFASGSGYIALNSRYFDTNNWLAGLTAMATFAKSHSNVVAMSLRNELRPLVPIQDFDNTDWYKFIGEGASAIHSTNSDLLIVIGGIDGALRASFLRTQPLDTSGFPNRTVWEFHAYSFSLDYPYDPIIPCVVTQSLMDINSGFLLEPNQPYTGPVWLSEFGVGQTGGPNTGLDDTDNNYLKCLVEYMEANDADWAYWALQGSYYVRNMTLNYDEPFGLLDNSWSDWRNKDFPSLLGTMFNATQGPVNGSSNGCVDCCSSSSSATTSTTVASPTATSGSGHAYQRLLWAIPLVVGLWGLILI